MVRLHYLQHVSFEDAANIEFWAKSRQFDVTKTELFQQNQKLPSIDDFDWLVVMGGPMNIYEEEKHPWLREEKEFIQRAIQQKKIILGVCLGAQLIADVLGAKVEPNTEKEIGWFPVSLTKKGIQSAVFHSFPKKFTAFHWHGDTFQIPEGANSLIESDVCSNQAFEYQGHVFGFQFHLESTPESVERLVENCSDELVEAPYIQSAEDMLVQQKSFEEIQQFNALVLENIEKQSNISRVDVTLDKG